MAIEIIENILKIILIILTVPSVISFVKLFYEYITIKMYLRTHGKNDMKVLKEVLHTPKNIGSGADRCIYEKYTSMNLFNKSEGRQGSVRYTVNRIHQIQLQLFIKKNGENNNE